MHNAPVGASAISDDGTWLVTGDDKGFVFFHHLEVVLHESEAEAADEAGGEAGGETGGEAGGDGSDDVREVSIPRIEVVARLAEQRRVNYGAITHVAFDAHSTRVVVSTKVCRPVLFCQPS